MKNVRGGLSGFLCFLTVISVITLFTSFFLMGCGRTWGGLGRCTYSSAWHTVDDFMLPGTVAGGTNIPLGGVHGPDGSNFVTGFGAVNGPTSFSFIIRRQDPHTQQWSTVHNFTYNTDTFGYSMAVGTSGQIYAVGMGRDGVPKGHGLLFKSMDQGLTWNKIYENQFVSGQTTEFYTLAVLPSGPLILTGYYIDGGGKQHGFAQRSTDDGQTWSTVDDFLFPGGSGYTQSNFVDANGSVYALGYATDSGGANHFYIRKSTDTGRSWFTASDIQYTAPYYFHPQSGLGSIDGSLYVSGYSFDGANVHWVTQKSSDGGRTWSTFDDFMNGALNAFSQGGTIFGLDANGSLWVNGSESNSSGGTTEVVRNNASGTFRVSDTFNLDPTAGNTGKGMFLDPVLGNIQALVSANDSGGLSHWVVRQKDCGL